jgi:hypothetical protein
MAVPWTASWQKPFPWDPDRSLPYQKIWELVDHHLISDIPMTIEHVMVTFFHETGFSNIRQKVDDPNNKGHLIDGKGTGFGQMEMMNSEFIPFFDWLGFSTTRFPKKGETKPRLTPEMVTVKGNEDFAIKMHCKWFEWLCKIAPDTGKRPTSVEGCLRIQAGGPNEKLVKPLLDAGNLLKTVKAGDRDGTINALNSVRWYLKGKGIEQKIIPTDTFPEYWAAILPQ